MEHFDWCFKVWKVAAAWEETTVHIQDSASGFDCITVYNYCFFVEFSTGWISTMPNLYVRWEQNMWTHWCSYFSMLKCWTWKQCYPFSFMWSIFDKLSPSRCKETVSTEFFCCLFRCLCCFCFFQGPKSRKTKNYWHFQFLKILYIYISVLCVFHLLYWNLRFVDDVTCKCTDSLCCPTEHQYQPVSFICRFTAKKDPILSSLRATEASSYQPSEPVTTQELQSPARHHFFSVSLSTEVTKESLKNGCPIKLSSV